MLSSMSELNTNGPRLSQASSERDEGAVAAPLPHALAVATTARLCQRRCHCPSWHVPRSYGKRTLCCRSHVFSAVRCTDAKSEIPPEQGGRTCLSTNNYTHLGQGFGSQLLQLLFSYLYTSACSPSLSLSEF